MNDHLFHGCLCLFILCLSLSTQQVLLVLASIFKTLNLLFNHWEKPIRWSITFLSGIAASFWVIEKMLLEG
ncbi:hypothetical protein V6R21_29255 [Limibacter armeniacum]|uniref:hypothetical protein n=1 Tax=Limibacter armeniacum TaxID=466084 RepID=UPI002FE67125